MVHYSKVLTTAQKKFGLQHALKNALPTVQYHLAGKVLEPSDRTTLFTCNIFPPLVALWYELVRKNFGDQVDVYIFDCSGNLDPADVQGATVQRYINAMHPTKIDMFLKRAAKNRKIVWICDDDVFPLNDEPLTVLANEFSNSQTATVSFRPRTWWHFEINGKEYEPNGSYCIALNREILEKEGLNAQPADGNNHVCHLAKKLTRYDTLDKANEELIKRGYNCVITSQEHRDTSFAGFDGTSIAALLLNYFPTAQATAAYFEEQEDELWKGNVLHRNFNALLAADAVRDLYEEIKGKKYPLPTMPSKEKMNEIRERTTPLLTEGRNYTNVDETAAKLRQALGI